MIKKLSYPGKIYMCTDRVPPRLRVLPSDLAYTRTEPSISFFFPILASTNQPHHAVLPALHTRPLTLHALSSVRGISECFRALYHLDAAPASVHHTVISAYLGCYLPSIETVVTVHVGSQCKSMQTSRCKPRARPGLSKHGDFTILSFLIPCSQDFGSRPRLSRGTRMSSRDESDPTLLSLH
jgi:hypothetical protein